MLLDPTRPNSVITRYSRDKWLHSVHSFEEDDWTEVGWPWEIIKLPDSNGRLRKIYWKCMCHRLYTLLSLNTPLVVVGAMAGYHSALAIQPGSGYGVIVLSSGHYPDSANITYDIFELMQPAFDKALSEQAAKLYSGEWLSADGKSKATISVRKGTLYADEFVLDGSNILDSFHAQGSLALRSSERRDEFRFVLISWRSFVGRN